MEEKKTLKEVEKDFIKWASDCFNNFGKKDAEKHIELSLSEAKRLRRLLRSLSVDLFYQNEIIKTYNSKLSYTVQRFKDRQADCEYFIDFISKEVGDND